MYLSSEYGLKPRQSEHYLLNKPLQLYGKALDLAVMKERVLTAWKLTEIVFDGLCSKRIQISASSKRPFLK